MKPLDEAIDALPDGGGTIVVPAGNGTAEVEVVERDRLGVQVRRVRVAGAPVDAAVEVERLSRHRALPPLAPVEVEPRLGGGVLRSEADADGWFEATVRPDATTVERHRPAPDGRERDTWALTRRDLGRWLEALART
jgi:hypothetical protein